MERVLRSWWFTAGQLIAGRRKPSGPIHPRSWWDFIIRVRRSWSRTSSGLGDCTKSGVDGVATNKRNSSCWNRRSWFFKTGFFKFQIYIWCQWFDRTIRKAGTISIRQAGFFEWLCRSLEDFTQFPKGNICRPGPSWPHLGFWANESIPTFNAWLALSNQGKPTGFFS